MKDTKEILRRAKQGDNKAIEQLLNEYQGLLRKASLQHHLLSIQDEAYSQACLSFYEAIMDFNESLGVPFAGFAKSKVYADVHTVFRRYVRIWQNEVASCNKTANTNDNEDNDECLDSLTSTKDIADDIIIRMDINIALTKLPPKQKLAFTKVLLEDLSMTQTAKELHTSVQSVSKNYAKAISSVKSFICHH